MSLTLPPAARASAVALSPRRTWFATSVGCLVRLAQKHRRVRRRRQREREAQRGARAVGLARRLGLAAAREVGERERRRRVAVPQHLPLEGRRPRAQAAVPAEEGARAVSANCAECAPKNCAPKPHCAAYAPREISFERWSNEPIVRPCSSSDARMKSPTAFVGSVVRWPGSGSTTCAAENVPAAASASLTTCTAPMPPSSAAASSAAPPAASAPTRRRRLAASARAAAPPPSPSTVTRSPATARSAPYRRMRSVAARFHSRAAWRYIIRGCAAASSARRTRCVVCRAA